MSKDQFQVTMPKPDLANRLARNASHLSMWGDNPEALSLIEQAIQFDQVGGLNAYYRIRADICEQLGNDGPRSAIKLYQQAICYKDLGRYSDSKIAYLEAFALDRFFLWSANNYAWMLATESEPSVRDGNKALEFAVLVCKESYWNCWSFIDTLAAAYATSGDLKSAVGWQVAALHVAPEQCKNEILEHLSKFQTQLLEFDIGQVCKSVFHLLAQHQNIEVVLDEPPTCATCGGLGHTATRCSKQVGGMCFFCNSHVESLIWHVCPKKISETIDFQSDHILHGDNSRSEGQRLSEGFDILRQRGDWPSEGIWNKYKKRRE